MANVLIAYYSRDGENYRDGRIVDLAEGNTQVVAKKIRQITGVNCFVSNPCIPTPPIIMKRPNWRKKSCKTMHALNCRAHHVLWNGTISCIWGIRSGGA